MKKISAFLVSIFMLFALSVSMVNAYLEDYQNKGYINMECLSSKTVLYSITEKGEERRDVAPGTAWEDVPDDFRCPLCGAVKNMFKAL